MKRICILLASFICSYSGLHAQKPEYKDVAGIFYERCTTCHHPGAIAPNSYMNYSVTLPWTPLIKSYLRNGIMPPWPPDTNYHRFLDERIITLAEKNAIINWIDSGAAKGDTTLAPAAPTYSSNYKLNGTPDLVVKIPTFTSNASTNDAYDCFVLPTGLSADRIIRAFEIVPGNNAIVHHVIVGIDTTASITSNTSGMCYSTPGDMVGGYAPGSNPTVFPGRTPLAIGMRLKMGSNLILQIHYPAGTAGQKDSTQVRLYFYPIGTTAVRQVYSTTPLQNWSLYIPANTIQTFTAQYPSSGGLPIDISIFGAFPHQHEVGVSLKDYAYSGIDTVPLISIPEWNFHWQGFYTYPYLVKIPTGYTLFATHTYDNTSANLNNPNSPPQNISAGPNTSNEMLFDSFQWLYYQNGDDTINIGNLLKNDTLLSTPQLVEPKVITTAYPNPFSQQVKIGYSITTPALVSISIYDLYGKKIKVLACGNQLSGYHEISWDGKSDKGAMLSAGVYFYTIMANKLTGSGKLILNPAN